jgi:hypothetical protein
MQMPREKNLSLFADTFITNLSAYVCTRKVSHVLICVNAFFLVVFSSADHQGCQMVYFKTKNPNLRILFRAIEWKMLVYVTAIWYNLWSFGIMYGRLV